jgi:beta-lactam-binding protein with PASTA domain
MQRLREWRRTNRQAIIGWSATALLLVIWLFLMDWIVMPFYTHHGEEKELPDITEHSFEKARQILKSQGLKIIKDKEKFDSNYPKGTVIFQNPAPYAKVKKGRRIYVTVSSGEKSVVMPQLVGTSERDAVFMLNHAGLILGKVEYDFNDYYPRGVVCEQSVPKDNEVAAKTVVDIIISRGTLPSHFIVPDMVGKNIETAKRLLYEAGLEVGRVDNEVQADLLPGTVIAQSVKPNTDVRLGKAVDLTISRTE